MITLEDIQAFVKKISPDGRALENATAEFPHGVWFDIQGSSWTMNIDRAAVNADDLPALILAAFVPTK